MSDSGIGLREIKKQLTRESIADAALQLALEKGLDNVTIEEIANLAFVSPRTFSNYFSCKEEAVATAGTQANFEVIEQLAHRPAEEPPLQSIAHVIIAAARERTDEQVALSARKLRLSREHPSLQPFQTAQYDALEAAMRHVVAERTGTDAETDLYPGLVTSVAVAATKHAITTWVFSQTPREHLPELLAEAFEQLGSGLPAPQPGVGPSPGE
ncbi:TetR family transcriptional regulator [Auraticoccus sp. F435]|uniref:TetR family transcriptional regulator n=1 Tax=Auraticoccus cholistanensis TaxID=2656650 RepID=A0A6A9UV35_9ACTN|nr:TetR family transcriptional regulator [Auraticoccus cholistanensis]MVA76541.1 TetR family transcriptional regulator [Auraticoccus cholistanensis]